MSDPILARRRPSHGLAGALCAVVVLGSVLSAQPPERAEDLRRRLQGGDAQGVVDAVNALAAAEKGDVDSLIVGAEAALLVQDFNHARHFADLAEKLAPRDPRPYLWNGHALFRMAEASGQSRSLGGGGFTRATFYDAATCYREARLRGGDAYTLGYFEAEALVSAESFEAAEKAVEAVLAVRPGDSLALALKGRVLLALKRATEAAAVLEAACRAGPGDRGIAALYLGAVMDTGDRARARAVFLEAVRTFPQERALYDAFVGRYQGERPDTYLRQALEEALLRTPPERDRFPLWYLGGLSEAQGRFEEALGLYVRYRDACPTTPEGDLKVGQMLTSLGRLEDARAALMRANALGGIAPDQMVPAFQGLVGAYVGRREFGRAALLQRIVVALSADAQDALDLGVLEFGSGRQEDGIRIYRQVRAREDLDGAMRARVENYLGLALLGTGDAAGAEECFRKALEMDDGDLDARENLGLLLVDTGRREAGARLLEAVAAESQKKNPPRPSDRARYHLLRLRHPEAVEVRRP